VKRRTALRTLGIAGGATLLTPWRLGADGVLGRAGGDIDQELTRQIRRALDNLAEEDPARADVRIEGGGPRLFINGEERYPLMALSVELLETIRGYSDAGLRLFAPIIGLNAGWLRPRRYDWSWVEAYFGALLSIESEAWFLPRLHLDAPEWWKDDHPEELIVYGLPYPEDDWAPPDLIGEAGLDWNGLKDLRDASLASGVWRVETGDMLADFLAFMESSPLAARMIGYQVAGAMNGEWHYKGSRYLPDYSTPMQALCGTPPPVEARLETTAGLLRDPVREQAVINWCRRYHEIIADTIVQFAGVTKRNTGRRVLCGAFYTYLLENICIQEAGHLAPQVVLESDDIDFLACPYSYQHTNLPGKERWESDVVDGAGNWLGRARGVGGDGGYRTLPASIARHGKLFIVEMDPSTYLEPNRAGEGGSGHETVEGTLQIIRRDLAGMFASGVGGWLFDFGHYNARFAADRGWYDDRPIIREIRRLVELGQERSQLDIGSVAEIAAVYDAESFCATQHWTNERPWRGYGIAVTDYFSHWLLDSQARTLHRLGAPLDFLYHFDLERRDFRRARLIFMVNIFRLTPNERADLKEMLEGSNATVVWFYAPGYITDDRFDLAQMQDLTGMGFAVYPDPGPMMIRSWIDDPEGPLGMTFGTEPPRGPRFVVDDPEAEILGVWTDLSEPAMARKEQEGWTSVYVGAPPLPVEILRWLARQAGVELWSSRPDVIRATQGAAAITATSTGERVLRLPLPMRPAAGGPKSREHVLDMQFGEVRIFTAR